jgi:hypothetical protein
MRSILATTLVAGLALSGATASNVINEHSGYYVEGVNYTIVTSGDYVFDSSAVNLDWFDLVESEDGPAAVMRLVIDVSQVDGADVSAGSAMSTLAGELFVKSQ